MNIYPSSSGNELRSSKFPFKILGLISINFPLIGDLYSNNVLSVNKISANFVPL